MKAWIEDDAKLANVKDLILFSFGSEKLTTEAQNGSEASWAITPVVGLSMQQTDVRSTIGRGNLIKTKGKIEAKAVQTASTDVSAKGDTTSNNVPIGASLALALTTIACVASTYRDLETTSTISFIALGSSSTLTTSSASAKGGKAEGAPSSTIASQTAAVRATGDSKANSSSGGNKPNAGKTADAKTTGEDGSSSPVSVAAADLDLKRDDPVPGVHRRRT